MADSRVRVRKPDRRPSRKLNFISFDAVQGPGGVVAQIDVRPNDSYSWDLSPDGKLIAVVPGSAGQIHIRLEMYDDPGSPEPSGIDCPSYRMAQRSAEALG